MDTLNGLPAHPLVVHIPVVLLPLAALGVGIMLIRRSWHERYRWAVLVIGGIGTVGAILAASTGESLERRIGSAEGAAAARAVHDHAEAGDIARTVAIVFFVALAAYVLVPWFLQRRASTTTVDGVETAGRGPTWLRPALAVAVVVTAIGSMITIIDAGHSGASKAWEDLADEQVNG